MNKIISGILVSGCLLSATIMAIKGIHDWGWFIVAAILLVSATNDDTGKPK